MSLPGNRMWNLVTVWGVIQMLPAGDAEKDATGRRWEQRKELMRDVIIYMRNNPSILFL